MMKKMLLPLALITGTLAMSALFTGCCSAVNNAPLQTTNWELEKDSMSGVEKSWQKPDRDITLTIMDGKVSGCAGVNRYFGGMPTLDMEKNLLKFGPMGCTMMAGPGLEYETLYLKTLDTVDSYRIQGDKLFLNSNGQTVLEFEANDERTED